MNNIQQSFRRYETKYLLRPEQFEGFVGALEDLLVPDKYGESAIRNIYLDTDSFYFIEHSLDKPVYKEKLRVRSYGNTKEGSSVFFEIKKKYKGVVYKRRIVIPESEAEDYIYNGVKPLSLNGFLSEQVFGEIDYLVRRYKPDPKLYLAYDRTAYNVRGYPDLRITFDKNIRGRWTDLTLRNDDNTELLDTGIKDYRLMEIKSCGAVPVRIARLLSSLSVYPSSFSKYGQLYIQHFPSVNAKALSLINE